MVGQPIRPTSNVTVFQLVWTYVGKVLDKHKRAPCACGGSARSGQVRILKHTYAGCIEHTSSRIFYALATAEGMLVFGADVTNTFGDAPPLQQGLNILPDKVFHDW